MSGSGRRRSTSWWPPWGRCCKPRAKPWHRFLLPAGAGKPPGRAAGVTFLTQEKSPKVRPKGGEPPLGIPPLSWGVFLSFRRPEPAAAQLPPAASGLLHGVCFGCHTPPGRLESRGTLVPAPLGVQARRLEHPHQAPVGGTEVGQVWWHQGGARRGGRRVSILCAGQ